MTGSPNSHCHEISWAIRGSWVRGHEISWVIRGRIVNGSWVRFVGELLA
ncbi:MAG: hypothetical protein ACKVZH_01530 [Blastocatellia bacterium]